MERYLNLNGNSAIHAYECGDTWISIQFNNGGQYIYDYQSAGTHNVVIMKRLAREGRGLNSFINTNVKENYRKNF